jgi:hypothetical protein
LNCPSASSDGVCVSYAHDRRRDGAVARDRDFERRTIFANA